MSNFVEEASFEVSYAPTHIKKWRSSKTGLSITYINQPSPVVNGYFAVATECVDDSGCPHTLEHLVFMGSHKYPYKGLLDTVGNRLYLSTNAWTAVDQTVYTLTTAGWDGFKLLLPIYLDHLLNPTLTDEACLTEVYHIDGAGKEKGVVFLEMQGIESQSWFISLLNMQRQMYPEWSGYSSETGGLMSELRKLTNDQIKDFHKQMYRPDNLCVIITGTVDETELLDVMGKFDDELPPLEENVSKKRPFVDSPSIPSLEQTIVKEVEFPDDDESMGEIFIAWIGANCDDILIATAIDQVGAYFTDSAISIFNKKLVEIESPYATDIDYSTDEYINIAFTFSLNGVPTEKLKEVDLKLKELIQEQCKPENIDLKYMRQLIDQQKLKFVSYVENSSTRLSNIAISEFIYGDPKDATTLSRWTQNLTEYEELLTWDATQWSEFISKWFVKNKSVSILGKPSVNLQKALKKEKKAISRGIKEKYGKEGLEKLAEDLKKAEEINDRPIPDDLLLQFETPDPSKIQFIETTSYKAGKNHEGEYDKVAQDSKFSSLLEKDGSSKSPLFFHFENYKSQFTSINIVMSSAVVSPELLRYCSIFEEIFSLPIQDGEKVIPYEDVIQQLNEDLLDHGFFPGYQGRYELLNIKMKFEASKYSKAIDWLSKIINHSIFDLKRVKIIVEKIINSNPDKKRNEESMMNSARDRTIYTEKSVKKAQDFIYTEAFYKELLEKIENDEFDEISKDLATFRNQLFNVDNMKIFLVGNCEGLQNPISTWNDFIKETNKRISSKGDVSSSISALPRSFEYKSKIGKEGCKYAHLVTTPATETSHLIASTKISTNYLDEDINKIALACEVFCAVEGPFWRGIRGTGLAYGVSIRRSLETGYLNFVIYRGSDAEKTWLVARDIINEFAEGKKLFDDITIENSIASIVNECANQESNAYDAANNKINDNIIRKRGPNYSSKFLHQLRQITSKDLVNITKKYFQPLFESKNSLIFSCIPESNVDSFEKFLIEQGFNVTVEKVNAESNNSDAEEDDSCFSETETESGSDDDSEDDDDSEEETESESEEEE